MTREEAIAKIKAWDFLDNDEKEILQTLIPELKESEDEKIMKAIIEMIHDTPNVECEKIYNVCKEEILALIEKQGERKPAEWHSEDEQNLNACLGYIPDEFLRRWLKDVVHVKYDKFADKVKPKFHEGAFIKHNKANIICKVISVNSGSYCVENIETNIRIELFNAEQNFHLWTIQDAKDGDVLYLQHDGKEHIIIYKGVIKERFRTFISAYCAYNSIVDAFCFADVSRYADIAYGGIMPATKEQRDLLFKKMREEGYEWDAEKKELNRIEKQGKKSKKVPIWKHWKDGIAGGAEGEQIFLTKIGRIYSISSCLGCECDYIELSELDKLMREEKQGKSEWTEEDDYNVRCCIAKAESDIAKGCPGRNKELIAWLKSLKQRMEE